MQSGRRRPTFSRLISERGENQGYPVSSRDRVRLPFDPWARAQHHAHQQTGDAFHHVSLQCRTVRLVARGDESVHIAVTHRQKQSFDQHGTTPHLLREPIGNKGIRAGPYTFRERFGLSADQHTACWQSTPAAALGQTRPQAGSPVVLWIAARVRRGRKVLKFDSVQRRYREDSTPKITIRLASAAPGQMGDFMPDAIATRWPPFAR